MPRFVMISVAMVLSLGVPSADAADADMGKAWRDMRQDVVSASEMLDGEVTDVLDPIGSVRDLLLDEQHQRVQYVLYQVPFVMRPFATEDGYVAFDDVALEYGDLGEVDLRIDDPASAHAPEQLEVTAREADDRLVSRLIGAPLIFPTGAERNVEDLLIDRQTGAVRHLVVNMAHEALFNEKPRTIPRNRVTIDEAGRMATDARINEVADLQVYNPLMLSVH